MQPFATYGLPKWSKPPSTLCPLERPTEMVFSNFLWLILDLPSLHFLAVVLWWPHLVRHQPRQVHGRSLSPWCFHGDLTLHVWFPDVLHRLMKNNLVINHVAVLRFTRGSKGSSILCDKAWLLSSSSPSDWPSIELFRNNFEEKANFFTRIGLFLHTFPSTSKQSRRSGMIVPLLKQKWINCSTSRALSTTWGRTSLLQERRNRGTIHITFTKKEVISFWAKF